MKSLAEMQTEIVDWCRGKGWRDRLVSFPEAMVMLHSEVSEALEAWRDRGLAAWFSHKTGADGQLEGPKPEGVGSEFADIFIRLLDDCDRFGVDLEAEYERKMAYNRTRPYRHGGKRL